MFRLVRFVSEWPGAPAVVCDGDSFESACANYQARKLTYTNGLVLALRQLGVSASDYHYNSSALVNQFLQENLSGVEQSDPKRFLIAALTYLKKMRPDVLLLQHLPEESCLPRGWLAEAKQYTRLVAVHFGFPVEPSLLRDIDVLLMASPGFASLYSDVPVPHKQVFYHYADHEAILGEVDDRRGATVSFVGSSGFGRANHQERFNLLQELLGMELIDCAWLEERDELVSRVANRYLLRHLSSSLETLGNDAKLQLLFELSSLNQPTEKTGGSTQLSLLAEIVEAQLLEDFKKKHARTPYFPHSSSHLFLGKLTLRERYPSRVKAPVFGLDYFNILKSVKSCLNIHTERADGYAANIRLFEATGCGALLITEESKNIWSLFEKDQVLTFRSRKDIERILKEVMEWPQWCAEMAARGREATFRRHTSVQRAMELIEIFSPILKGIRA